MTTTKKLQSIIDEEAFLNEWQAHLLTIQPGSTPYIRSRCHTVITLAFDDWLLVTGTASDQLPVDEMARLDYNFLLVPGRDQRTHPKMIDIPFKDQMMPCIVQAIISEICFRQLQAQIAAKAEAVMLANMLDDNEGRKAKTKSL